ncbi:heparan-alpha-glucosaminide N-acetyltransferase domain-containing protein [Isoptericola croceus]|uniref:heparan-alpha-glucosaminide N-acetyltransferase domain-containing protein n=1 Tax=Isoptericola croceus TaxID=3031406 RepID=UPI0023F7D338|nr:heparan-alpha-glucosaminide N-acetyltransferase domain-containing protein [Isoptericola croceus]
MTQIAEPPVPTAPQSSTPPAPPVRPRRPRLKGIDLARGLAIIGMFGAHTLVTERIGWDPSTWAAVVHGRSSILFATLAGVSLALMSGGHRAVSGEALRDARTRVLVRAALIYALGAVLAAFDSVIVILEVYAVLLVIALPFLRWSPRRLFVLAGALAVVGPIVQWLLMDVFGAWEVYPTGFLDIMFAGTYPGVVWISFVLLGLGVGRLDLTSRAVRARLVAVGLLLAVAGYAGGWASARAAGVQLDPFMDSSSGPSSDWLGSSSSDVDSLSSDGADPYDKGVPGETIDLSDSTCYPDTEGFVYCEPSSRSESGADEWDDEKGKGLDLSVGLTTLVGAEPHSGTTFEVVGSSGVALLLIGLCLLAPRPVRRVLHPVAAAGTMALTLYALHIVALSLGGPWVEDRTTLFFGLLVAGALVVAVVWKRWLGQGPLERLVSVVSRRGAMPGR